MGVHGCTVAAGPLAALSCATTGPTVVSTQSGKLRMHGYLFARVVTDRCTVHASRQWRFVGDSVDWQLSHIVPERTLTRARCAGHNVTEAVWRQSILLDCAQNLQKS